MNFEKIDRKWSYRFQNDVFEAVLRDLKRMRGFEAHWRLARAYHFAAMQRLESGEGEAAKIAFARGYEGAKWANSLEPKRVEGQFWMAVCGIERARLCGKLSTILAIGGAKRRLQIALKLDEAFHFAGSHRVLGRIFHLTPRVLGGNDEKAERHFRRAL
ncbi:MAG: TRAP transporter TatT component family protein, partial [Armatimonadetes bacterium]|nr:TRAP transporter TatT component family protein [Armatimonadota bacterium]